MIRRLACCVALLACGSGCEDVLPDISWERMIEQERGEPYEASPYFPDGRLMQLPPPGTIAIDHPRGGPELNEGLSARVGAGDRYVDQPPVAIDRARLERGRDRFELFCATCHGLTGTGVSLVAQNMLLRKPPSLVEGRAATLPAGRVFQVISSGYGFMPAYAYELSTDDRWSVVSYLRVLQRSRAIALSELPPELRERAQEALR